MKSDLRRVLISNVMKIRLGDAILWKRGEVERAEIYIPLSGGEDESEARLVYVILCERVDPAEAWKEAAEQCGVEILKFASAREEMRETVEEL